MIKNWTVVTGCSSGLGRAVSASLTETGLDVFGLDLSPDPGPNVIGDGKHCDVRKAEDVAAAAEYITRTGRVRGVINCAGVNYIEWLESMKEEEWDKVIDTNAKGIFLMAREFAAPLRETHGFILNVVSNAAHVPMRCSLAYNASKAAAHIMTLQLARELAPLVTVFGVAPNKMSGTQMSTYIEDRVPALRGWTKEKAAAYQKASLLTGEETPPEAVADFITFLLSNHERHRYLSGCILPYGA